VGVNLREVAPKSTPREVVAVYKQVLDPVAHSLGWSSLVAAVPLLLLFVMLGVLRITPEKLASSPIRVSGNFARTRERRWSAN
jgi:hypothetical protein